MVGMTFCSCLTVMLLATGVEAMEEATAAPYPLEPRGRAWNADPEKATTAELLRVASAGVWGIPRGKPCEIGDLLTEKDALGQVQSISNYQHLIALTGELPRRNGNRSRPSGSSSQTGARIFAGQCSGSPFSAGCRAPLRTETAAWHPPGRLRVKHAKADP